MTLTRDTALSNNALVEKTEPSGFVKRLSNLFESLARFANRAGFAYSAIIALQLKAMWGIWLFKDLTPGDTIMYFYEAADFYRRGKVAFAWSPMYTTFSGLLLHICNDAWVNIIMQRLCISLGTALLFLALMRRLLPPQIAWFAAAWFVVLPINFNALYEVHEFAVIPVLCAWLTSLNANKTIARAGTAFVMWTCGALMRNEISLAAGLFTLIGAGFDSFKQHKKQSLLLTLRPYLCAAFAVALLVGLAYIRSPQKGATLMGNFHDKHVVNVCQIYAFNYQQRHPEWTKSPWVDCYKLVEDTFGTSDLSMLQAIKANPKAMLEYYAWNIHLIPNGLQTLLFNVASGTDSPDYVLGNVDFGRAVGFSMLMLSVLALGLSKAWRERKSLWNSYGCNLIWCFISMACVAVTSILIMLMQRPRPSYIFTFGMTLMFLTGFSLWRLGAGTSWGRALSLAVFPLICATFVMTPSYYMNLKLDPSNPGSTFLADEYHFLKPFLPQIAAKKENVFTLVSSGDALMMYLYGPSGDNAPFGFREYEPLIPDFQKLTLPKIVAKNHLGWLLLDECLLRIPTFKPFSEGVAPPGWKLVALKNVPNHRLMLYERVP